MNQIKFKPTTFRISQDAVNYITKHHLDNDAPYLALEAMRGRVETKAPKLSKFSLKSLKQRIVNIFRSTSQLNFMLDKEKGGPFTLSANRSINDLVFRGEKVPVDFVNTVTDIKPFDEAVSKVKANILENLSQYNKDKKIFRI